MCRPISSCFFFALINIWVFVYLYILESKNSTYTIYYICYTIVMVNIEMTTHNYGYTHHRLCVLVCEHGSMRACERVFIVSYESEYKFAKIWHIIARLLVTDIILVRSLQRVPIAILLLQTGHVSIKHVFNSKRLSTPSTTCTTVHT